MKKLVLLSILLTMCMMTGAQSYLPLPDNASEWRVDSWTAEPEYSTNSYYRDFIDGDTIINTLQYHKVYNSGYTYYLNYPPGYYMYYEHVLHGFLREENNRWYTFNNNQDELLYDFTLNVGDTVFSAFTFTFEDPVIVTGVDSILVDGEYKRRLRLNFEEYFGAEYIIEDIGATSGLFENMYFFEWGSELVCFAKYGASLWGASTEECDLAVDIGEKETNPNLCFISPNPAKDHITVTIPEQTGEASFSLFDLVGKVVYNGAFICPSVNKIKVTGFPSGMYIGIIETPSAQQIFKLIKN